MIGEKEILTEREQALIVLLRKYMNHVLDEEGTSFVGFLNDPHTRVHFSDQEKAFLILTEQEALKHH